MPLDDRHVRTYELFDRCNCGGLGWGRYRFHLRTRVFYDDAGGISDGHGKGRDVTEYYAVRAYYCALTNGYAFHDVSALADPGVFTDEDRLDLILAWRQFLGTQIGIARMRIAVKNVNVRGYVDVVLNLDTLINC